MNKNFLTAQQLFFRCFWLSSKRAKTEEATTYLIGIKLADKIKRIIPDKQISSGTETVNKSKNSKVDKKILRSIKRKIYSLIKTSTNY